MKFEIARAKNGSPVFQPVNIGNERIMIHSAYDPEAEADRIADMHNLSDCKIIVILGLGLGYLIESILKKYKNSLEIIVVESQKQIFKLYCEKRREYIEKQFPENKISYIVEPDEDMLLNCFSQKIIFSNMYKLKIIEHHNSIKLSPKLFADTVKILNKYISFTKTNLITAGKFGEEWLTNSIKNATHLSKSCDISLLKKYYSGKPAVIVSAGPSLDRNIEVLKKFADNYIIFCVDTAFSALIKNGIIPDFLGSIDSQYNNYLLIKDFGYTNVPLITTLLANSKTLEEFSGSMKFFFSSKSAFDEYLEKQGAGIQFIKSGGSVATSLFSVCKFAECNPIVFIGQDLAMTSSKTHSSLTRKLENNLSRLNKFSSLETIFYSENSDSIICSDIYGQPVSTTQILYNFCRWFEIEFSDKKRRYINSTGAGILKNNIEIIDFQTVSEKICTEKIEKNSIKPGIEKRIGNKKKISETLAALQKEMTFILECADDAEMLTRISGSDANEVISMPAQFELFEYEMTKKNLQSVAEKLRRVLSKISGKIVE